MKTVLSFYLDKYIFITTGKISFELKSSWNPPSSMLEFGGLGKSP